MTHDIKLTGTYQKGCFTLTASIKDGEYTAITVASHCLQTCAEYLDRALKDEQE